MVERLRLIKAYFVLIGRFFATLFNLMYGIWKLSMLKTAPVTVFGGTYLHPDSIYLKKAAQLARMLADSGITVLTGGGPGIMEAAMCGALGTGKKIVATIGISVKGIESGVEKSPCKRTIIEMSNFAARKLLLINYSTGFAVFPGGFGTVNELTELLVLIQTKKRQKTPIVLIGIEYWTPFMQWLQESALRDGLVTKEDVALFTLTDDIDEAFRLLNETKPFQF